MSMPKAALDEYYLVAPNEMLNQAYRGSSSMKAKTKAKGVNALSCYGLGAVFLDLITIIISVRFTSSPD